MWGALQVAVWLLGAGIVVALLVTPEVGLHAFWNVLIPVAPALLVVAPGVWRNVCPLATTALLPRRLGRSRATPLPLAWQGRLAAVGVALLLLVVPLRHVVLDLSGLATGLTLLGLAGVALLTGAFTQGKSGWCSGICPVHPVEKLYGQSPLYAPANAHCQSCTRCVRPCPEATPAGHPLSAGGSFSRTTAGTILVGGFPGYVYGWFQVPDFASASAYQTGLAYLWPFLGLLGSLLLFTSLRRLLGRARERTLIRLFAAAAVCCYYWFRLPALFGFGVFPGDGMLVDLSHTIPAWAPLAAQLATTLALAYLLVWRPSAKRAWTIRPPFARVPGRPAPLESKGIVA